MNTFKKTCVTLSTGVVFLFTSTLCTYATESDEAIKEDFQDIASSVTLDELAKTYDKLGDMDGLSESEKNDSIMKFIVENHEENSTHSQNKYYPGSGGNGLTSSLNAAETKLMKAHPIEAIYYGTTAKSAQSKTIEYFKVNGFQDKSDAFRHAYWNATLTVNIGASRTKVWTDAHESTSSGIDKQMDLFNNQKGIEIGSRASKVDEKLAKNVYNDVKAGKMKIIVKNKLVSSKF